MTFQAAGLIRDYDPATDTCTVELTSAGAIDAWIDAVTISKTVDRGLLAYTTNCVLTMPDAHRICEAVITTIFPPITEAMRTGAGIYRKQSGRVSVVNATPTTVTFPVSYINPPTVTATADHGTVSISAVTTTNFTFTPTGSGLPTTQSFFVSWSAVGA